MIDDARKRIEAIVAQAKEALADPSRLGGKKAFVYGGLLAVSLVLFLTLGGSRKYPDPPPSEIGVVGPGVSVEMEAVSLPIAPGREVPEEIPSTWETWGRDLFATGRHAPVERPDDPAAGLALSGISWRDGQGVVLIDDLILREGERVYGSEIVNILPGCVVLDQDGHKVVLCMSGEG